MNINSKFSTSPRLLDAVAYARAGHDSINQKRKYSGEPYWFHVERVALNLINAGVEDEDMIIAALFHDLAEDVFVLNPEYSPSNVNKKFGGRVTKLMLELTDVYTKEAFPNYNRKLRHEQERTRLSFISEEAKVIKASDIKDNTEDILSQDPKYGIVYLAEKKVIISGMFPLNNSGYQKIVENILDESTRIGQYLPRH